MPPKVSDKAKLDAFNNAGMKLLEPLFGDSKTNLRYECVKCGFRSLTNYNRIQTGRRCPKCARKEAGLRNRLSLEYARGVFRNVGLELLASEYKSTWEKLNYRCTKCGYLGKLQTNKAKQGRGCKECGISRKGAWRRTENSKIQQILYQKKLSWIFGVYKNSSSLLGVRCNECKDEFELGLDRIIVYKTPCKSCRKSKPKKQKYDLQQQKEIFNKLGLRLLENVYLGYSKPARYECKECAYNGKKTLNSALTQKTGCKKCAQKRVTESHRLTSAQIKARFAKCGAIALEEPESLEKATLIKIMRCGHEHRRSLLQVENRWKCRICHPIKNPKLSYEKYLETAKSFRGELIHRGGTAQSKSTWKCEIGHVFERSLSSILAYKTFCSVCVSGYQEMLAKAIVEKLFSLPFVKIRIPKSKSLSGRTLELDLFNQDLQLAIEVNGMQHYQPVDFEGRGMKNAEQRLLIQKENDRRRRKACREKGIALVEVREIGYVTSIEDFRNKIGKVCARKGIALPNDFWSINLEGIRPATKTSGYWEKVVFAARKIGLDPENNEYSKSTDYYWWRCNKGCRVQMMPTKIVRGRVKGCPECYKQKHQKPVELSDGRVFASGAEAARALGVMRTEIYAAIESGREIKGFRVKRIKKIKK
jgi:hypothetical protein